MKGQPEDATTNAQQPNEQLTRSAIWGCPRFIGYHTASDPNSLKGDINRNYPPYSMNCLPSFTTTTFPDPHASNHFPAYNNVYNFEGSSTGTWYKLIEYTHPAERALLGDARWSYLDARKPADENDIPGQPIGQKTYTGSKTPQCMYDFYRHGTYPPVETFGDNGTFSPNGGKVAFNILYADMHVTTATDRLTGYRSLRMRFPK